MLPFSNFEAKTLSKSVVDLNNNHVIKSGIAIFNKLIKCALLIKNVNENLYFFNIGDSTKQENIELAKYPIANAIIPKFLYKIKKNKILTIEDKIGVMDGRKKLFSIWYKLLNILKITLNMSVGKTINRILLTNIFSSIE